MFYIKSGQVGMNMTALLSDKGGGGGWGGHVKGLRFAAGSKISSAASV